ncbi:MAG TPA: hypothetical protein VMW52_08305, partial [Phycisphaerae bacterium]|nr:hypothetical protein [Phycisphaerae bacterium]
IEAALRDSATREMKATAAALKKHGSDMGGFHLWRREFFADHAEYTERKLRPIGKAAAALFGKDESPYISMLAEFARARTENHSMTANEPGAAETWADRVPDEVAELLELIGGNGHV